MGSNLGVTLPEVEKFTSGIGYIALPSDIDRDTYLLDCFQNHRVSLHTEQNGFINRANISEDDLNSIEFPTEPTRFGTPVYYILDPVNHQPYVIKRYAKSNVLGTHQEHDIKVGRFFGDAFVEMSGNPNKGYLNLVVNSDSDDAQLNIVVNNKNQKGKINVEVLGDVNVSATGSTNIIQNVSLLSKTVDSSDDSKNTTIEQQTQKIAVGTPMFIINEGKENFVLGQKLKKFTDDLLQELSLIKTPTMLGLMPAINVAKIAAFKARTDEFLSSIGYIDK